MTRLTKRTEATAFPNGTQLVYKKDGKKAIIERQCQCGDWLHYDQLLSQVAEGREVLG